MKKTAWILILALSITSHADDMEEAYARAKAQSGVYNTEAMMAIQKINPNAINANVPEANYRKELTSAEASKTFALSNSDVKEQYDNAKTTLKERELIDENILVDAENIAVNASQYVSDEGYCKEGDCHELIDAPNTEMIQSTAVLEDVLGGGQSYSASGKEAKIYTGKSEKCKDDNWGFADCCTDKGWGVDLNLANCPKATKDLGKKKEKGLCHYVGKYKEKIRVAGVVVRIDEYKGYCCFPSKMARITQEGAKPQLKLSWGNGKYPSCQGLTSNQFAKIDFSKIDMREVYGDIEKNVVVPANEEMLEKPEQYYKEQGVASW